MQDTKKFIWDKNCVYKCCYEKGVESAAGKMRQGIKWQINCIGLSMVLLGTLTYTLGAMFWYTENNDVW